MHTHAHTRTHTHTHTHTGQLTGGAEGPAGAALSLVLYRSDHPLLPPVHLVRHIWVLGLLPLGTTLHARPAHLDEVGLSKLLGGLMGVYESHTERERNTDSVSM